MLRTSNTSDISTSTKSPIRFKYNFPISYLFGDGSSGRLSLEDLLDNLLFFNEEGTDDTVTDTAGTTRSTVSTADRFGVLTHAVVFSGTERGDLQKKYKTY